MLKHTLTSVTYISNGKLSTESKPNLQVFLHSVSTVQYIIKIRSSPYQVLSNI